MSDEPVTICVKIMKLPRGGFVLVESGDHDMGLQAAGNLNELKGALSTYLDDWDRETTLLHQREYEDQNPNVVTPRHWWRRIKSTGG